MSYVPFASKVSRILILCNCKLKFYAFIYIQSDVIAITMFVCFLLIKLYTLCTQVVWLAQPKCLILFNFIALGVYPEARIHCRIQENPQNISVQLAQLLKFDTIGGCDVWFLLAWNWNFAETSGRNQKNRLQNYLAGQ